MVTTWKIDLLKNIFEKDYLQHSEWERIGTCHMSVMNPEFIEKHIDEEFPQLLRYLLASIIASAVDLLSLYTLTEVCGVYYLTSASVAFLFGLITSYFINVSWVFDKRKFRNKWFEFVLFSAIGIVGLGLNELFIWFFTEHMHFYYLFSKVISMGFVFVWNFCARKNTLFI